MFVQTVKDLKLKSTRNLYCLNYEGLDDPMKLYCPQIFTSHNFSNEYTIWYIDDFNRILLGYIQLIPNSICNSKYFNSKVYNSWELGGIKPENLAAQKAYQIVDWQLDNVLKDKDILLPLFTFIAYGICDTQSTVLLWRDGTSDLDCYPVPLNYKCNLSYALGAYYADIFMKL